MPASGYTYHRIDHSSNSLPAVMALGRRHAATLGFFPDGAFLEHAQRRNIIVALDSAGKLGGYLLFRESKNVAVIVHLCVAEESKGAGIALQLIRELRSYTAHLDGIRLKCRRDYAAAAFWPKANFVSVGEVIGRGKEGKELTVWWLNYHSPGLFNKGPDPTDRLPVVIDTNVLIDIHEERVEASLGLLQEWLTDEIEICVTSEIFNDIDRDANPATRNARREFARKNFPCKDEKPADVELAVNRISPLFSERTSVQTLSDIRQLARAVAAGITVFITRDEALLSREAEIYDEVGLSVVSPAEMVIRLDSLERGAEYQPVRLAGGKMRMQRVGEADLDVVASAFHSGPGENKAAFRKKLADLIAYPREVEAMQLSDGSGPQAMFVLDFRRPNCASAPIFRVRKGPLAATLARQIVLQLLTHSANAGQNVVVVSDRFLSEVVQAVLKSDGFVFADNQWIKATLSANLLTIDLEQAIKTTLSPFGVDVANMGVLENPLNLERACWPAKCVDADIPTFVVSIQPKWAQHLFDHKLVEGDMFGLETSIGLNRESVYYKSNKNSGGLRAPGRILWYVSGDRRFPESGFLRACSFLDEVVVDKPKSLFHKFRRLGIYQFSDLQETVSGDLEQAMMALRFSDTCLLKNPISFTEVQKILKVAEGKEHTLISPVMVPTAAFKRLIGGAQ